MKNDIKMYIRRKKPNNNPTVSERSRTNIHPGELLQYKEV